MILCAIIYEIWHVKRCYKWLITTLDDDLMIWTIMNEDDGFLTGDEAHWMLENAPNIKTLFNFYN